jgi:hypothetical protein
MDEHLYATQCIDLLDLFLDDAYETGHQDLPVRQAFVYRHARNISEIAEDVLTLEADDRISSCFILMRSLFESFFNVIAAVKHEAFAVEKAISEIENDLIKIRKWQDTEKESSPDLFADTVDQMSGFVRSLREEHGVKSRCKWTTYDVANAASLDHHYVRDYFLFSRNTHASCTGIICQEFEIGREMILQNMTYIVLATIGHAVQVSPCKDGQSYLRQATSLLESGIDEWVKANNKQRSQGGVGLA